jgi:hypothetical protein
MPRRRVYSVSERVCPACGKLKIFPVRNQACSPYCTRHLDFCRSLPGRMREVLDIIKANVLNLPAGKQRDREQRQYDKLLRDAERVGLVEKGADGPERRN